MRLRQHVSLLQRAIRAPYEAHLKHLRLKGLQPKTIEAYARAVRTVGAYFDGCIDDLSEQQLLDYFTDRLETHSWSAVKLDLYGLKFYYAHVLRKPWVSVDLVKPPKGQRLPDIVTVEEARRLIEATRMLSYRVFFFTLYSLGLRLGEGLALTVADIDAARRRVHIRAGKGNKDRFVPLPATTLECCVASGGCIAIRCCCFPIARADSRPRPRHPPRWIAAACSWPCARSSRRAGLKKDHAPQSASQLCHTSDRGRCRSAGSPEDPRSSLHPHHRPLHPPDLAPAATPSRPSMT
jgi:integrase/recombinase XerD